jgi:hypothetical protein
MEDDKLMAAAKNDLEHVGKAAGAPRETVEKI